MYFFRHEKRPVYGHLQGDSFKTYSPHGGPDPGCVGVGGELEKDINLAIALNLRDLLEFSGFAVVMTRDTDISIHDDGVTGLRYQKLSDMENRKAIIMQYPESIFISIHQNQYTQPQYFGAQMFYSTVNRDNFRFAQIMQDVFREIHPENDREAKLIDGELYLFRNTPHAVIAKLNGGEKTLEKPPKICYNVEYNY